MHKRMVIMLKLSNQGCSISKYYCVLQIYSSDMRNGNLSVTSVLTTSSILSSSSTDEENRPDMDILQLNNNPELGKEKLYLKGICAKNGC